jgi:hypothetical protein
LLKQAKTLDRPHADLVNTHLVLNKNFILNKGGKTTEDGRYEFYRRSNQHGFL